MNTTTQKGTGLGHHSGYAKNQGIMLKTDELDKTWSPHHVCKTREEANAVHPLLGHIWKRLEDADVVAHGTVYADGKTIEVYLPRGMYRSTLLQKKKTMMMRVVLGAVRTYQDNAVVEDDCTLTVEEVFPTHLVNFLLSVSNKGALEMGMFAKWRLKKEERSKWIEAVIKGLGVSAKSVLRGFFATLDYEEKNDADGFNQWNQSMSVVRKVDKKLYASLKRSSVDGRGWVEMWLSKRLVSWDEKELELLRAGSSAYKNLPCAAHVIADALERNATMTMREKHASWWNWFTPQGIYSDWGGRRWTYGSSFPVAAEAESYWRSTLKEWMTKNHQLGIELIKTMYESDQMRPYLEEFLGKPALECLLLQKHVNMSSEEKKKARAAL